ncbi:MAG: cupin domain-containing protein [Thermoanaerobaculaceae bacterium]
MRRIVLKPWGQEEIFADTPYYVGKILTVHAGHALSLQFHEQKVETMRVLSGEGEFHLGAANPGNALRMIKARAGDIFHIPPRTIHRIVAKTEMVILEVSTPHLDDVVRLEDRYGRVEIQRP